MITNMNRTSESSKNSRRFNLDEIPEEDTIGGSGWVDESTGFDDILDRIGSQGKYQKCFLYLMLCPIAIIYALGVGNVYMFYIPDHWCHDPNWNQSHFSSYEEWKNHTIPKVIGAEGKERFSKCEMYLYNDTGQRSQVKCHQWKYDKSELELTIPSEFDWVCERKDYTTLVFTVTGVSSIIGTIMIGPLPDRFGRKIFFIIFTLLGVILNIILLFLPQYFLIYLCLLFVSCLIGMNPDIILHELTDSEFRSWISAATFTAFVIGLCAVPLIAWLISNWFYIGLVITLSRLLVFVYFVFIPESPRWLAQVGRVEEAKKIILEVARVNGTLDKITDVELETSLRQIATTAQSHKDDGEAGGLKGYLTLLSYPRIVRNTVLLAIAGAASGFIYGGITLNTPYMPGNQFLAFFLLAVIELPSSLAGGYLMQTIGRRWTPVIFFTLSAISCFTAALATEAPILVTICIIVSKFAVNLTLLVETVQDVELYPTSLRATGGCLCSLISQLIGLGMPYVVGLGRGDPRIPYFAFAIFSICGGIASLFLPETLHQNLPETISAANEFGKDHKFWRLRQVKPKKLRRFVPVSTIRKIHSNIGGSRRSGRRESVVSLVSQVHPTVSVRRRPSTIGYVGI